MTKCFIIVSVFVRTHTHTFDLQVSAADGLPLSVVICDLVVTTSPLKSLCNNVRPDLVPLL